MSDLPAALTPADCDLRDFAFMPLDIIRLFGSRFHAVATDAEWRAGVTLWAKSFHQVPAASVPDDDVELCRLAELGRDIKTWRKVREVALHGWVKCSDGRLYHPVVSEKANEAWNRKKTQRARSAKGNAARWGTQDHHADESGVGKGAKNEQGSDASSVLEASLRDSNKESHKESHKDRKGQGQGELTESTTLSGKPDAEQSQARKKLSEECAEVLSFLNEKTGRNYQPVKANIQLIAARLREGATVVQLRQVIAKKCREWRDDPKQEIYLRPKTLFNATNFANYQGELVA